MFKPLDLNEEEEEIDEQTSPLKSNNNNNNNAKYKVSDRELNKTSKFLVPNNNQQMVRAHSIGHNMTKNALPVENGNAKDNPDEKNRLAMSLSQPLLAQSHDHHLERKPLKPAWSGQLDRADVFYTGSIQNIARQRSHTSLHSEYGALRARSENVEVEERLCGCIPQDAHETITRMMSFSLLKDPVFIIFVLSNFMTR